MNPAQAAVAHKRMQQALAARTTRDLLAVWPLWQPGDRASWDQFVFAASLVIRDRSRQSAELSSAYYRNVRTLELGDPPKDVVLGEPPADEQLNISLTATGVVSTVKALRAGKPLEEAKRVGFVRVARVAERHVLNAGRETLVKTSEADPESAGWVRHTAGTCDFCEERAGSTGTSFEVHDGCQCSAEPVFATPAPVVPVEPLAETLQTSPVSWFKSLTPEEFKAGEFYKGTGYKSMNPALRGKGEVSALMEKRIELLDSALNKGALAKDTTLFRMAPADAFGELKAGTEFVDRGYISTSLKRNFAGDYRHNKVVQVFEIAGKAGQRGGYADQFWRTGKNLDFLNPNLKEAEYILPRGTKFKVTRVWEGSDKVRHVALEVVKSG